MRKGISPLVSAVLYVAIAVAVVGIVLSAGTPILDRIQDTAAITNSISFLQDVDLLVQEVRSEGRYSARPIRLNFERGKYVFDNTTGEFYYELDTRSNFISAHSSQRRGNILITANADVSVTETTVNGTDCYMMENQHLKACVRKLPSGFDGSNHPDLVGFWRLDEGTGQWANDSSSGDNDGKLGGSTSSESSDPSWVSGVHLNALDFDGDDDEAVVPYDDSFNVTGDTGLTVQMWYRSGGYGEYADMLGTDAYGFHHSRDGDIFFDIFIDGSRKNPAASNLATDTWHFMVGRYNGTHASLFHDGDLIETQDASGSLDPTTTDFFIGNAKMAYQDAYTNATIDSVRVYDRALTSEEIEWAHLQRGDVDYINTSELLVSLHNKDLDEDLDPRMTVLANAKDNTVHGTGSAVAERIGGHLGRGRVTAKVNSSYGLNYDLNIDLISGSDFLKVDVIER